MTDDNIKAVDSGVAFPDQAPDADVSVQARFLESGQQLQQVFIGLEPALVVQPEYDAEENEIIFVTTAVDLDPQGLVDVLEVLLDAAKTMAQQQAEAIAEFREKVAERARTLQAEGPDEYPEGYYVDLAYQQILAEQDPEAAEQIEADKALREANDAFEAQAREATEQ